MTNFVRLRDVDYILDTLVDSQNEMLILGIYVRHVTHHGNMKQKVMRISYIIEMLVLLFR